MSDLHFDVTANVQPLETELKKTNQTVNDWAKGVEKSASAADRSIENVAKNIKLAIFDQKHLIKSIEADTKQLRDKLDSAVSPGARRGLMGSIAANEKDLVVEKQKLLDLQRQQIAGNAREEQSNDSIVKSLGRWAGGLATVAMAVKIGKEVINSTKDTMDQFEFAVTAAKNGLDFFWKTLATGDFSNFFTNMQKAIKAGYDYAEAMDRVKEATWAQSMTESGNLEQKAKLEVQLRDRNLSPEERKAAGDKRMQIERDEAAGRIQIAKDEYNAALGIAMDRSKLDAESLVNILKQTDMGTRRKAEAYDKDVAMMKQKQKQMAEFAQAGNMTVAKGMEAEVNQLKKNLEAVPEQVKLYSEALKGYGGLKEEMITNVVSAYNKLGQANASVDEGTKRIQTTINTVEKEIADEAKANAKKVVEDKELDNRIKATQELMRKANAEELAGLAQVYIALVKEKNLREELINQAILKARNPDGTTAPVLLTPRGNAVSKNTAKIEGLQTSSWTDLPLAKAKNEQEAETLKLLEEQREVRLKIADAVMTLTYQLAEQIGMSEEDARTVGGLMDAMMKAASGDFIGAAVSTLSTVIALIPTHAKKFQAQIEEINSLLEKQQRLIEKAQRFGNEDLARQAEIKTLEEKKKALEAEQDRLERKRGFLGLFTGKKKLEEVNAELDKTNQAIEEASLALDDFLSGGVTENTLADSIAQAFQDGKTGVDDFGEYMNQVLMDAVLSIFKSDILADMEPLMKKVRDSLADKNLTAEERDAIKAEAKRVADLNKDLWDNLTGTIQTKPADQPSTGLSGQISRSITETTGTELAGLFRRFTEDNKVTRNYTQMAVDNLMNIEANTLRTANNTDRLKAIEDGIKSIDIATNKTANRF